MAEVKEKTSAAAKTSTGRAEKKDTKKKYFKGIGRRKTAVAQVRLYPNGKGAVTVNGKEMKAMFDRYDQEVITSPLQLTSTSADVTVVVKGGGPKGQAEAIRHGISRALELYNKDLRKPLKAEGYLKRDPRSKERKKPGLKKARKARQWSKR